MSPRLSSLAAAARSSPTVAIANAEAAGRPVALCGVARGALSGAQEGSADASPSREFVDGEVGDVRDVLAAEFHLGGLDAIREEDADDADDRGGG